MSVQRKIFAGRAFNWRINFKNDDNTPKATPGNKILTFCSSNDRQKIKLTLSVGKGLTDNVDHVIVDVDDATNKLTAGTYYCDLINNYDQPKSQVLSQRTITVLPVSPNQ